MADFTKRKFLDFPVQQQHKKCAELLRTLYEKKGKQENISGDWEHYLELLKWMDEKLPKNNLSFQNISDLYHDHLRKAQVSKKEHHLLPHIRQGDRSKGEEAWPIAIYLDQIRSAHNVGSIIRTTEALSLGALYFSPTTPSVSHSQVKNTSMGSNEWVACHEDISLASLPHPIIALETSDEAFSLYEFIFPNSFTLVVGNEEYGCSESSLAVSDYLVEIPMRGRKNSLNVANAFAMAASEISRQRKISSKGQQ